MWVESCQENSPEYAALFAYYEKLAAVLTDKADLGVHIKTFMIRTRNWL